MAQRLADATSPYLQQHAGNPVDWWPWGDEAFAEARRRDVPLFISVGYSACHWCHVMAHESFEDPAVAEKLNRGFVAVKVDREERPDVDAVYMRATTALTGQGGWPMSVFATPDGEPFFAGTYYPPEPRHGMPSFGQVLDALADAWAHRRGEVLDSASAIVGQLAEINALPAAAAPPGVRTVLESVVSGFDPINGGWGTAPKFPAPRLIDALLVRGDRGSLDLAQRALQHMARGGIHDQIGGGFHRYAVDPSWAVPHFEKMLYDNALLLGAYARGWRRTPRHEAVLRWQFERAARGIVTWLTGDMLLDSGAFAASMDADSLDLSGAHHEGIFYVWSPELLADALGPEDAAWAAKVFHVTERGTFEHGLSTLQLVGVPDAERLARVSGRLLQVRDRRFFPARDDKVVAAWNGWLIASLVWAAEIFAEESWLDLARGAAEALWSVHVRDGVLYRTSRGGVASGIAGFAEDYGAVASGFAHLAGALGDATWLRRAEQLLDAAVAVFAAPDGGFFDAPAQDLYERPREIADNPTPPGSSALIEALRHVGLLADRADLAERADAAAATTWGSVERNPRFAASALGDLLVADEARRGLRPAVVVVVDEAAEAITPASRAAWRMAPAGSVILRGRPGTTGFAHHFDDRGVRPPGEYPLRRSPAAATEVPDDSDEHDDVEVGGTVYVCRGRTCFPPASTVKEIRAALWQRA